MPGWQLQSQSYPQTASSWLSQIKRQSLKPDKTWSRFPQTALCEPASVSTYGATARIVNAVMVGRAGSWVPDSLRASKRSADLHFNSVPLLQGSVQQSWGVDDLPTQIFVVCVAHKQRFGREGIRLHVHIRPRHLCKKRQHFIFTFPAAKALEIDIRLSSKLFHKNLVIGIKGTRLTCTVWTRIPSIAIYLQCELLCRLCSHELHSRSAEYD